MFDHLFLSVSDVDRSVSFYARILPVLGISARHDYDGKEGPAGHPDLKGFGSNGKIFFWLRQGPVCPDAIHVGFMGNSESAVNQAYAAALSAGATVIHPPGPQLHYDPRYYAAQVMDPDGYSLEFVYKSWQHGR
ncbi:VOC family protein [Serratia proteamaculans]|uniref:VOC family protein n=1 Tax=Serratia proteamaculans TaxID=28151 RepID=UPI00217A2490|nr:VOC family protein [Serratia proteamaculans]CAI0690724.1 Predicted lactoylglutathione lyase [Serratia proteamaculans]